MRAIVNQTANLLEALPDEDVSLVNQLVKKLILLWDPDYTKLTPSEQKSLREADEELTNGEVVSEEEVWD